MKKINFILLIIISQLLMNCSNNNSSSSANPTSNDATLSFKLNNDNYEGSNLNLGGCKWNIQTNSDGSHYYHIEFGCNKVGDNIIQGAVFHINSESIVTNQIFPCLYSSSYSQFTVTNSNAGYMSYVVGQNTTGQIKITSFDGSKMSGEFSYVNLRNAINGSAPTANVSNGIFTNVPFHN